jgi:hypothetical protein
MATEIEQLPAVGDMIDRKIVEAEHPDRSEGEKWYYKWRFYRESYEGSGGYAPFIDPVQINDTIPTDESTGSVYPELTDRTYLFRHPVERVKFQRRAMMAYLINIIRRALNMLNGFITKQTPMRDGFPDQLNKWIDECTPHGDSWDSVKNTQIIIPTLYYGFLPVLIYKKPSDAPNAALDDEMVWYLSHQRLCWIGIGIQRAVLRQSRP